MQADSASIHGCFPIVCFLTAPHCPHVKNQIFAIQQFIPLSPYSILCRQFGHKAVDFNLNFITTRNCTQRQGYVVFASFVAHLKKERLVWVDISQNFSSFSCCGVMTSKAGRFLPDDVILQILARLPVKSLFRSRLVCKLWHRLSGDAHLIHLYTEVSSKNPLVLVEDSKSLKSKSSIVCVDNFSGVSEVSLEFLNDRVKVRASCNGLLCCSSIPNRGVYYVCNPMTRKFKELPKSGESAVTRFHPDGEPKLGGLVCNLSTNKFRVVVARYHRIFGHRPGQTFICLVFDSELNKWRKFVSLQSHQFTQRNSCHAIYVNGSLHWLAESGCIVALDIDEDNWRRVEMPPEIHGSGNRVNLLEWDGCLSVVQMSSAWMNTWVLRSYERQEWHLEERVSLRCVKGLVPPGMFPVCQSGACVFLATHNQILVYHRGSRLWKEIYSTKNGSTLPLWFCAHAFQCTILPCQ